MQSAADKLYNRVMNCCYRVHRALVPGFLESVYHNALLIELRKEGLNAQSEYPIEVCYDGSVVGQFKADIIVDKSLIIELKAVESLCTAHEVQLVNYLTATGINEGILVNFGSTKIQMRRKFRLPKIKDNNT